MSNIRRSGSRLLLPALAILVGLEAACIPMVLRPVADELDSPARQSLIVLAPFGQSFVSQHAGLTEIAVYLGSDASSPPATATLHLRTSALAQADLRTSTVRTVLSSRLDWHSFAFEPIPDSRGQAYYFFVELAESAAMPRITQVLPVDAYHDGVLYVEQKAQDAQLAHRLSYDAKSIAAELLSWAAQLACLTLLALAVLVLPGFMLLSKLPVPMVTRMVLAPGMTCAVYAIVALWTHLIGLQIMFETGWAVTIASIAWLLFRIARADWSVVTWRERIRSVSAAETRWFLVAVAFVVGSLVITRYFVLRTISIPMWGDSYQHAVISQLLIDHNGLFVQWAPYAELKSFTYHYGFHVLVAIWHWVSAMPATDSVLWIGQWLNALAVLSLIPLVSLFFRSNGWGCAATVLVAGLLAPMPMFYVNWGRYTQLAGQVLLPLVVLLTWRAVDAEKGAWHRHWIVTAVAWAGLALTHYRVLLIAMCFAAALIAIPRPNGWREALRRIGAIGAAGLTLALPWYANLIGSRLLQRFQTQLATPATGASPEALESSGIGDLSAYLPGWMWALLVIALLGGLWRGGRSVRVATVWWALVLLAANPFVLGLPGRGVLPNFAIFIAAYIPAGIALGGLASWLVERTTASLQPALRQWIPIGLACLIAGSAVAAVPVRLADLHPETNALAFEPDKRAADWIRANTAPDAKFLVNSFFAFRGSAVVGSDGGWWLPLLADRRTTLPPLNYTDERGPGPDYMTQVNSLAAAVSGDGLANREVLARLRAEGVTHIYVGQRQGHVNYSGTDTLDPQKIGENPAFETIYHQDRVWVFRLLDNKK